MTRNLEFDAGDGRHTVVVFTHSLLEPSMTFILSHAERLRRYRAFYAGMRRVAGLELPEGRWATVNRGGVFGLAEELLFRRFGTAPRLVARLRRTVPSLVHAHFGLSGPSALKLATLLRVPLVVTYHGRDATISDQEVSRTMLGREFVRGRARVMERARLVIAVSDFIREKLIARGYPPEKIVTHRNGIDTSFFQPSARRQREPVVVFVGRFVEKKGCEFLLRALGELRRQGLSARAVLIGDGPLRGELERITAELDIDVEFAGFLPLADVRDRIGAATAVVVPSVTAADGDSEGLPTVILEAQAMGTPVIATRHAGNAEGVAEGRSALLVAEKDVPGLARAIRTFLDRPDAVNSFGSAGRDYVQANFRLDMQVEGLERIYDAARARAGLAT
jgi:glycosyltransferase involved in cell wall biosynthesis